MAVIDRIGSLSCLLDPLTSMRFGGSSFASAPPRPFMAVSGVDYWRHLLATQGNFAGHGDIRTHLATAGQRYQHGHHGYACRRPIFGDCSRRYMNMYTLILEDIRREAECLCMSTHIAKRCHSRLFHYIA